jgi:3-hydroxyisobutyrate dehydrogenase-like beta-hydroxyacid dehydrogenase
MTFPPVSGGPNEPAEPAGTPVIAVLGLGEAGGAIAADLIKAGVTVRAYDPAVDAPDGSVPCADEADATTGADLVLSVNSAAAATDALRAGLGGRPRVWADLNTSAPKLKRELAGLCAQTGVPFADVALMSPVPGKGLATPALTSGTGSRQYAGIINVLGGRVTALDGPAGLAATRKLLRSVFYKGMAAAIVEALAAARAAGHEDWLRANIVGELVASDEHTLARLETGTVRHALRRSHEMAAAAELLDELGVPPRIASASRDWLEELSADAN